MNKHYFLAVKIPIETKKILATLVEGIKTELIFRSWVHPDDYHITLAFLGNATTAQLHQTIRGVEQTVFNYHQFTLQIEQFATFGRKDSPRIFYGDVVENQQLTELRDSVFTTCEKVGFLLETRPYKPHLTLARNWTKDEPFPPIELKLNNFSWEDCLLFQAEEVVLYQTNMEKTPKYEEIHVFSLR
jgi:2'-5' RNA ligase